MRDSYGIPPRDELIAMAREAQQAGLHPATMLFERCPILTWHMVTEIVHETDLQWTPEFYAEAMEVATDLDHRDRAEAVLS